jgi:hypothetical protein
MVNKRNHEILEAAITHLGDGVRPLCPAGGRSPSGADLLQVAQMEQSAGAAVDILSTLVNASNPGFEQVFKWKVLLVC